MGKNFWPVYVSIAVISGAITWKFAPEAGQKLPSPVRDLILATVQEASGRKAPPAPPKAAAEAPAQADTAVRAPAARPAPAPQAPAVAARKQKKPGTPAASAAPSASGSPYLEPAAKALSEYKALSADFEKRRSGMDLAQQRATMKKLHALNERVEFYNTKHREWKKAHPAAAGR